MYIHGKWPSSLKNFQSKISGSLERTRITSSFQKHYTFLKNGIQVCFWGLRSIFEFLNKHEANKIPTIERLLHWTESRSLQKHTMKMICYDLLWCAIQKDNQGGRREYISWRNGKKKKKKKPSFTNMYIQNFVLSRIWLFVTPWTVARQAPLSIGLLQQGYWSGLPFPLLRGFPNPGIRSNPRLLWLLWLLHWQGEILYHWAPW